MDVITNLKFDRIGRRQHTLKSSIDCVGSALHSGERTRLLFRPAPVDTGIVFRRTDLGIDIPARYHLVTDARLCTRIANPDYPDVYVSTVEHVMAALAATGVDNAIVEVSGPEIPALDGSSSSFLFLIDCVGRAQQSAPRQTIEILHSVSVSSGEASAELHPGGTTLDLAVSIDFPAAAIGRQALSLSLTEQAFRDVLAGARTFTMLHEIKAMQAAGLALGGSLENALVIDGENVINPEGLRSPDECVRHKMLDAVGDLALAGAPIHGRFVAHRTGHALNNRLLRALFADQSAWRIAELDVSVRSTADLPLNSRAA